MKAKGYTYALIFVAAVAFSSCSKSSTIPTSTSNTQTFVAVLNGASETPPNASTATGTATFTYDNNTYTWSGTITYAGITSQTTMADIRLGTSGNILYMISATGFASPLNYSSNALFIDAGRLGLDLGTGVFYVNIYSTAFPNGEIGGHLIVSK